MLTLSLGHQFRMSVLFGARVEQNRNVGVLTHGYLHLHECC